MPHMTTYAAQCPSGLKVDRKWIRSGPEVGQKWTGTGPKVDQIVFIRSSVHPSVWKRVQKSKGP